MYADGILYTFGSTGMLSAFDATSGEVVWQHDSAADFGSGSRIEEVPTEHHVVLHHHRRLVASCICRGVLGRTPWIWCGRPFEALAETLSRFDVRQIAEGCPVAVPGDSPT